MPDRGPGKVAEVEDIGAGMKLVAKADTPGRSWEQMEEPLLTVKEAT